MKPTDHYEALVEFSYGSRRKNNFIRSAGLGIDALVVKERHVISWKPGVEVDEAHVLKTLAETKRLSDEAKSETEISSFRFISLTLVKT